MNIYKLVYHIHVYFSSAIKLKPPLAGRSAVIGYELFLLSAAGIAVVTAVVAAVVSCTAVVAVTAYAEQENEDDDPAAVVTTKVEA